MLGLRNKMDLAVSAAENTFPLAEVEMAVALSVGMP
ncbi:hypothetical protein B2K_19780 [Paenibacillus mucilaginosus K02]|nr:hypothetical protein B2K_19780 [Paenibacillus mucilaginosus K02]